MSKADSRIESALAEIRAQLLALAERVAKLEGPAAAPAVEAAARQSEPAVESPVTESIPEEDLLAISAAIAARFGVRVKVRQIRLITTSGWAQQGRVSVQASHRLH
jgi:methylmalonyl-CoA carboxyltransferase large subunit